MSVVVHEDYLKRRFVARWCSVACFANFVIVAGAFILPLYIAWASQCAYRRGPSRKVPSGAASCTHDSPSTLSSVLDKAASAVGAARRRL